MHIWTATTRSSKQTVACPCLRCKPPLLRKPNFRWSFSLQILGLTATPTSKDSLAATLAGMRELARNLAAEYVVVDETDAELLVSCRAGTAGKAWTA